MTVFVRVAELRSFSAAAAEFGISATMVGKHIRALEQRLGARLIQRTTRRQQLTEAGSVYYARCKPLLEQIAAADASIDELRAAPRGLLRITATVSVGSRLLAPLMGEFLGRYPEVHVELCLTDRIVDLVEEGFDAGIRTGTIRDENLVARPLGPYRMQLCAAPGYLAAHGTPRKPADLSRHEFLNFSYRSHSDYLRLIGPDGVEHRPRVRGRLRSDNADALRMAALAGAGIVMHAAPLLEDDVRSGRLVRVLPKYELPTRTASLVYPPDRRSSPKLQCFVEFAREKLGGEQAARITAVTPKRRPAARAQRQAMPRPSIAPIAAASKPARRANSRPRSV